MTKKIDISYILETETYIEKTKNEMPKNVYEFIRQVCIDEKKYIDLVESYNNQKGVLKVPEIKMI